MRVCAKCGKKGILLHLSYRHLCRDCEEKALREEQERWEKEREKELEKQRDAEIARTIAQQETSRLFDSLRLHYREALAGKEAKSISEVKNAIENCDAFEPTLESFLSAPYAADLMTKLLEGQSIVYILPDLGLVGIKHVGGGQVQASFDNQVRRIEDLRREYTLMLEKTDSFNARKNALQYVEVTVNVNAEPRHKDVLFPIQGKNITKSTPVARLSNFVVIDTETTGLSPTENEIIQLTAINYVNLVPYRVFSTYIRPHGEMGEKAKQINGITEDMVQDAPYIEQVLPAFTEFLGEKTPLVGHNISFDLNFLQAVGLELPAYWNRPVYDTLDLAKREYAYPNNKLSYLCRRVLHVIREDAHDAVSDALATGDLFLDVCRRRIGEIG